MSRIKCLALVFIVSVGLISLVKAECNRVTFEGCAGNTIEGGNIERPHGSLFDSHLDAEGNYFHMLEGLAIMTIEIQKRLPDFQGFPLSIFTDRQYQDCSGKGIIYHQEESNPNIGVCFVFANQQEAESNYSFGVTTYYQYWDKLQGLLKSEAQTSCDSAGLFRDGREKNLYKPDSDIGARCTFEVREGNKIVRKAGVTVLLDERYNGINQLDVLDQSCNKLYSFSYFGLYENKRPRFCLLKEKSVFNSESVYLSFSSELKKVENASNRED